MQHTCGIDTNRKVHCWGSPELNRLKISQEIQDDVFVNVAVGFYHACAINLRGFVKCWGVTLEREFRIQNYTHHALVEQGTPDLAVYDDDGQLMNRTWTYLRPIRAKKDYRDYNFLPLTLKHGYTY